MGSYKKFPFIFDTGAQTVIMDSLLNEIGKDNYDSFSFGKTSNIAESAFNNEEIKNSITSDLKTGNDVVLVSNIAKSRSEFALVNVILDFY